MLGGCTTTHVLGQIDDPGVREEVDRLGAALGALGGHEDRFEIAPD